MRRPLLAAALLLTAALSSPLAAQGVPGVGINPFNYFNDPPGSKPDGWVSQHDPFYAFSATGNAQLAVGNYGGPFEQALGANGTSGSLAVTFFREAGFWGGSYGGQVGGVYTFRGFLRGVFVSEYTRTMESSRQGISYSPGEAFDYLEITLREPNGAQTEVIDEATWLNAEHMGFATPEPASMALLGTGLAGLAGAARRRRQRKQEAAE